MSPLVLPRSFLASDASMAERVVFILCIVFGSLLSILLTALAIYCIRRRLRRRREAGDDPHRTSSFFGGAPSVADLAPPQPTRRASTRTVPRIAIPSPELGSVFRFDLAHRGSYPTSRPPSGPGLTPKKGHSPQYDSLFSRTSTMVASPMPEKGTQLRVINPSPLSPKIGSELQKPVPAYRAGFNSSRERLVSSAASADSLFTGTTSTPPLSPPDTWSNLGTNTIDSPVDVASSGGSVLVRKSLSQQSYTTLASPPPHISVECFEMASLEDPEHTPRAHGASPLSLSAPQDRWDPLPVGGATGTPVTLSHFPFRFSAGAPHSPGLPSIAQNAPVLGPQGNTRSPRLSDSQLSVPGARVKVHGLGLNRQGSRQSLPSQSAPALKLKIKHHVSDEIIAIAFAPRTINFGAVSDGVRGRLGFEPRRVWTDAGTDITDDASLWKWLEEQYTQGHTRLMLHVE